jgi:hypothetical protein
LLGVSSNIVTSIFAHKDGQYCDYEQMPLDSTVIIEDARPKIVDAWLTLISIMRQGACHFPFPNSDGQYFLIGWMQLGSHMIAEWV